MRAVMGRTWRRSPAFIRTPVALVTRTFRLYMDDNCSIYAAAIAYYALFSLVPLSLIVLSVLGLVVDRQDIVDFVFEQVPLEESAAVEDDVNRLVDRAQRISLAGVSFGVLALIWSGSGIFSAVRRGLNATGHRPGRPYWHGKLIDFALIPGLGVLIWLSLSLTATAQVALESTGSIGPLDLETNLAVRLSSYALPALMSFGMFALLYRYVPTVPPGWAETLAGAGFAMVLFELAKNLGAVVVSLLVFSQDTAVYAGFSTAFAFLFWMFVNGSILLLGAEFARAVAMHREHTALTNAPARERRRFWNRSKGIHPSDA
ncbi:MAG: YihY/virulence factor BrkB family protein [Tepidiformaceae bacterium]